MAYNILYGIAIVLLLVLKHQSFLESKTQKDLNSDLIKKIKDLEASVKKRDKAEKLSAFLEVYDEVVKKYADYKGYDRCSIAYGSKEVSSTFNLFCHSVESDVIEIEVMERYGSRVVSLNEVQTFVKAYEEGLSQCKTFKKVKK